jgi:UPF0176 protein
MSPSRRRRPVIIALVAGLFSFAAVACSDRSVTPPPIDHVGPAVPASPATVQPVPAPQPIADGPCRYLSPASVQAANGERVIAVRLSDTGPDRPQPACFFFAANGTVQLRTWIVGSTPQVARATVDAAAPVASSDLAELAGGWSGGSQPTADGAVFAVSRQGTAVVITTNQRQTIGARRIAEQVIAALGL